jgi:antitoxin component of MazEF toxin-antitoxin module
MHERSASEVLVTFLKLGLTSFGGPIAHIGYFRDEIVVRRQWVDDATYTDLVALCQFLPGPASSQVGFSLGLIRAGYWGALAAWTGFLGSTIPLCTLAAIRDCIYDIRISCISWGYIMRVAKWGNSLAIRLPDAIVKTLKLKSGDEIEIVVTGERVFEVQRDKSRQRALARLRALKKPLPKGFRFDREEANAR